MRVVVIGGSGFTGRHVLRAAPSSWEVGALARSDAAAASVRDLGATALLGDLDDAQSVDRALKDWSPDAVIVVASLGFGHADGLIDSLRQAGSPRCVFTSTTGIFTRLAPASKDIRLRAELSIAHSGLPYTIIRPTMIYGAPGDRNMERLLKSLRRLPVLPAPAGGHTLQQPVHVEDLAAALIASVVQDEAVGQAINVAGPVALPFAEIIRQAGTAVHRRAFVLSVPVGPMRSLVGVQERALARPRLKIEQIDRLLEDKAFGIEAAKELLGYSPRSFAEGITAEARLLFGR